LDIGCGNGFATAFYSKRCKKITGVDFSREMISRAVAENSGKNISYQVADVRTMNLERKFNKIITQRCLINILDWKEQRLAIRNISGHLASGGYFLMMEGIADGRRSINELRIKLGLEKLSDVKYNLDFHFKKTNLFLKREFIIEEFKTFGMYEFITRIIYPLYIYPQEPTYGSPFHNIAGKMIANMDDLIPSLSKFGMWILKKKGK
jgi:SAM-dependent methyltransferase